MIESEVESNADKALNRPPRSVKIGYTAADIKDALRRRHPAFEPGYAGVGRWTTTSEWMNIDLLALDAWQSAEVIGYEVKVSRSDMRSELLDPTKRAEAVAMTTRFYFAVPAGLLTHEEKIWEEPEWEPGDFYRPVCTNPDCRMRLEARGFMRTRAKPRGPKMRGTELEGASINIKNGFDRFPACCNVCKGYGRTGKSRVELEAPTLWIPRDVGLIEIKPNGCHVMRESPVRKTPKSILGYYHSPTTPGPRAETDARLQRQEINRMMRWVSARPDPRHADRPGVA